jgi:hypothetical protein
VSKRWGGGGTLALGENAVATAGKRNRGRYAEQTRGGAGTILPTFRNPAALYSRSMTISVKNRKHLQPSQPISPLSTKKFSVFRLILIGLNWT